MLTDLRLVNLSGTDPGPGRTAIAVRPADPAIVALLQPGMAVSVVGLGTDGGATVLTAEALVLSVLPESRDRSAAGRPVLLAVRASDADRMTAGTLAGDIALRFD